jgi:SAM-dependent methyltransferase
VTLPYYVSDYRALVEKLLEEMPRDEAMVLAVGGPDPGTPLSERGILEASGLQPESYLVDIGCGSGRLAGCLDPDRPGRYLGTDIVPDLLDHARAKRPHWRFELVEDLIIPEEDDSVDMVCLFSVVTHLRHEDSYVLLAECARVLKPNGCLIVSFLELVLPTSWSLFEATFLARNSPHPMTTFIEEGVMRMWAEHLIVEPIAYCPPDVPFAQGLAPLGQSVMVMRKW